VCKKIEDRELMTHRVGGRRTAGQIENGRGFTEATRRTNPMSVSGQEGTTTLCTPAARIAKVIKKKIICGA